MEHELKNTVITLYKQNKWKEILELENGHTDAFAKNILWVWPSLENFDFIKRLIIETGLIGLISIGCGCGLLEWMFKKYSTQ
ncbi:rna helicase [Holotrichia oblita]|uniref:Rna helicase n=1 Tax=Holotrichia oblita TaxID=644536 RepID=A0ACB9TLK6_HOLOL|nr:rna helicase [Holotrichia oblita]